MIRSANIQLSIMLSQNSASLPDPENLVASLKAKLAEIASFLPSIGFIGEIEQAFRSFSEQTASECTQLKSTVANEIYFEQIEKLLPVERDLLNLGCNFHTWKASYGLENLIKFLILSPTIKAPYSYIPDDDSCILSKGDDMLLEFRYQGRQITILYKKDGIDWDNVLFDLRGESLSSFLADPQKWPAKLLSAFVKFIEKEIISQYPEIISNERLGDHLKLGKKPAIKVAIESPTGEQVAVEFAPNCVEKIRSGELALRIDLENDKERKIVSGWLNLTKQQSDEIQKKMNDLAKSKQRNLQKFEGEYCITPWKSDLWQVLREDGYLGEKSFKAMQERWLLECDRLQRINAKLAAKGLGTYEVKRNRSKEELIEWFQHTLAVELDLTVTEYDWQLIDAIYKLKPSVKEQFVKDVDSYALMQRELGYRPWNLALKPGVAPVWKEDLYREIDALFIANDEKPKYNPEKLLKTAKATYTAEEVDEQIKDAKKELKAELQAEFNSERQVQLEVMVESQSEQIKSQSEQIKSQSEQIKSQSEQIKSQSEQIKSQSAEIADLKKRFEELMDSVALLRTENQQLKEQTQRMQEHSEVVTEKASTNGHSHHAEEMGAIA